MRQRHQHELHAEQFDEPGSDELLDREAGREVREQYELDVAALVEEDRKTEAIEPEDDPKP